MDAVTLDPHECVVVDGSLLRRWHRPYAQREGVGRPRGVPQPRARVGSRGAQPGEVEDRTLHPAGRGKHVLDAGETGHSAGQLHGGDEHARRHHRHGLQGVTMICTPRPPQREQATAGRRDVQCQVAPFARVDGERRVAAPGVRGRRPLHPAGEAHVNFPRSCAPRRDTSRPGTEGCRVRAAAPAPGA